MFLYLAFLCFVAKFTWTSCAFIETSTDRAVLHQTQNEVPPSSELQLRAMQEKIDDLERNHDILMEQINFLRENIPQTAGALLSRNRRNVSYEGYEEREPTRDCTPGSYGCPLYVTPLNVDNPGPACSLCPPGPRGPPGPAGPPGADGSDSYALITNFGVPGKPASASGKNASGAVYIRWGHRSCPANSTTVYTGSAAAPSWNAAGNGADQLCLPDEPAYNEIVAGASGSRSFVYGVEYEIDTFPTRNNRSTHDVPCAVCKASMRFTQLMIPGRNVCPDKQWTLEYHGYLMAARFHSSRQRSLHYCVDQEMETIPRSVGAAAGSIRALISLVEGRCSASGGGLRCGPYVDGNELTCAVCTQ